MNNTFDTNQKAAEAAQSLVKEKNKAMEIAAALKKVPQTMVDQYKIKIAPTLRGWLDSDLIYPIISMLLSLILVIFIFLAKGASVISIASFFIYLGFGAYTYNKFKTHKPLTGENNMG